MVDEMTKEKAMTYSYNPRPIHINVPDHVENEAAYIRGAHRRIERNRQISQRLRAAEKRHAWLTEDPTRAEVVAYVVANAEKSRFFGSLAQSWEQYGTLTPNQEAAVRRNISTTPEQRAAERKAQQTTIADAEQFAAISSLFDTAASKLKYPKIVFGLVDGPTLKLGRAGENSNAPGAINVKVDGEYAGRIHRDGKWAPAREFRTDTALLSALTAFAADPVKAAAEYGHRTGHCCFCARPLTDARSVTVGYGPVCADHYNLPWGEA